MSFASHLPDMSEENNKSIGRYERWSSLFNTQHALALLTFPFNSRCCLIIMAFPYIHGCCVLQSVMYLFYVPLEHWWQVAFWPDKHPPLSQYSPELTLNLFNHTLFVCGFCGRCDSCLLWQSSEYMHWTQVLAGQMKSFSYVCCLIDTQWQFFVGRAHTPDVSRFRHYLWHS